MAFAKRLLVPRERNKYLDRISQFYVLSLNSNNVQNVNVLNQNKYIFITWFVSGLNLRVVVLETLIKYAYWNLTNIAQSFIRAMNTQYGCEILISLFTQNYVWFATMWLCNLICVQFEVYYKSIFVWCNKMQLKMHKQMFRDQNRK